MAATGGAGATAPARGRMLDFPAMRLDSYRLRRGFFALTALLAAVPIAAQEKGWHFGPGAKASRPASGIELQLAGYVQEDFRSFHDYENSKGELPALGEQTVLRRLRLGVDAQWKRLAFEFDYDPHDSNEHLKNLTGELKISKALHITGGSMKLPVSPDWLTSAAKTDFIERNLVADALAPGRDWGVKLSGDVKKVTYQLGVFKGDGRVAQSRADTTAAGRLEVTVRKGLELAASASQGKVSADAPDVASPVARGVSFHAPSGFRVYERHFVDGTRRRLGADARFRHGPIGVRAEVLQMTSERTGQGSVFDDLPSEVARGWSASATWLVTGDRKARTIKPDHPITHGGIGAVELGLRYDALKVDDAAANTGFEGAGARARNIRPVGGKTLTGGLSWWPLEFVRFYGNAVVERYDDPLLAPVPGKKGSYVTLLGRLQLSMP
jgi:phosphate-selective porin